MTLRGVPAFTIIMLLGPGVQAEAQAPCAEVLRLRNAASEAWKHAMSAPGIAALRSLGPSLCGHGGDAQLRGQ